MLKLEFHRRQGALQIDLNLRLDARVTALFGASGAGKSSILHCIAGLAHPDSGLIELNGRTLWSSAARVDTPPEHRKIGYIFQDARLFPHLSVRRNLEYGVRARQLPRDIAREEAVIELLGLAPLLERSPRTLSGGEQQRVAIGRAVMTQPELLLLDEPLASLDLPRKTDVLAYLLRLRDAFDLAMLYVSHDRAEILQLADEVVWLHHGCAVGRGSPATTLTTPEL